MGRVVRWLVWLLGSVTLLLAAGLAYFFVVFPVAEQPRALKVERTPARLERGTYLAEHVAVCTDCHSERDFSRYSAPVKPGTLGKGGTRFGHELGLPGEVVAPNITPHALSRWTDGELVRAFTSGVSADGRALFPLMNYPAFSQMCEEDVMSIVSYVRSLAPVANDPPRSELDFPLNLIVRTIPKPAPVVKKCPDPNDSVAYGRYLVTLASCADCHTPHEGPEPVPGKDFAGGVTMHLPGGFDVTSANLTPDLETGIGGWSKETFINRFKPYRNPQNLHQVKPGERQTIMPWSQYAGMSDRDLGAIYDFLRTQKPVRSEAQRPVATR